MALAGNELVLVTGILSTGSPSGEQFLTTTQQIANLGGGGGGGYTRVISNINSNTTAGASASTDYVYFCTGTLSLTLPAATSTNRYSVINTGTGTVTVVGTINGLTNLTLAYNSAAPNNYPSADLISNGTSWGIF